jgi:hypothetical protein
MQGVSSRPIGCGQTGRNIRHRGPDPRPQRVGHVQACLKRQNAKDLTKDLTETGDYLKHAG